MKASIIIITFLTIFFVIVAVMISAANNAPDSSINYSPRETSAYPKFEIVTEKKSIYELMKNETDTTSANGNANDDVTTSESEKNKILSFNKSDDEAPVTTVADEQNPELNIITEKSPAGFNSNNKK